MAVGARRGVTAIDRVMLGYLAFNTAVLVWRAPRLESWGWLIAANTLTPALILLLARAPLSRFISFVGGAYGIILTLAYYTQVGVITTELGMVYDGLVQSWEAALFGGQVSVAWQARMPHAALSWVLHAGYVCYYALVALPPLFLFARRSAADFASGCFRITIGFYACYALFLILPVAGPRFFFGVATGPAAEVLPARLAHWTLAGGSAWGTAFPSSHVVAAWCAVASLWRPARRLAIALWPVALALALGTVYGQFHYAVDSLAAALLAGLLLAVAAPLERGLAPRSRAP